MRSKRYGPDVLPLFVAGYTERLPRKMPFIIGCTVIERIPYLLIAIAIPLLATTPSARVTAHA